MTWITFCSWSQQDEQASLYMQNPLQYNPAYAGSRQSLALVALARFQWVRFDGAPKSQWFSVHAPVARQRAGVGLHLVNDAIGSRNRTSVFADISSNIVLNKKGHRLAVGLTGGADFLSFNFSDLNVTDPNDPFYGKQFTQTTPNLGAGMYYFGERHFVGISVPRLFEIKYRGDKTEISKLNKRHYFISAGIVIPLNSVVLFKPSTLIKYTANAPLTFDINTSFLLYEKWWIGAMYRFNESVGVNVLFRIKNVLQIGYGYDFTINKLTRYNSGSHEVLLTYDINFKRITYNSPRYF
jgi:type IX secretion system PorP/SprF family membrane protein